MYLESPPPTTTGPHGEEPPQGLPLGDYQPQRSARVRRDLIGLALILAGAVAVAGAVTAMDVRAGILVVGVLLVMVGGFIASGSDGE